MPQGLPQTLLRLPTGPLRPGAPHREFSKQERHADRDGKEDIRKHEHGAAVGAGHVGELPNGPKPDGRTRRSQNKSQAVIRNLSVWCYLTYETDRFLL